LAEPYDDESTPTTLLRKGVVAASAEDDRAHYLVVVAGTEPGRRFELGDKSIVIGRTKPADIVISDTLISRNHCRVGFAMGQLFVTDLGSSNGTFIAGARIDGPRLVAPGERFTVGSHVFEHELRSRREVQEAHALDSDLDKAKRYVRSLLPGPIAEGAVRTDWVLQPSAKLGGDMFGYHFIDERTFAIYLLDVTGHGTDAAMHAVSVMNVLRQRAPRGIDARDPARMAAHLNEMFPMESHGGMLLSLWYGVVDLDARAIAFTSAGHHAAYLVGPDRESAAALDVSNVLVGMMPGYAYAGAQAEVPAGSSLYLFSDGVFEIEAANGLQWGGTVEDFVPLLTVPAEPGKPESQRILEAVMARTGRASFEDDFTLVVAAFR
jgi:serine phosphatase RsbU (regulator of sigma subunit)